jgi:hypothetical protein
MAPERFAGCLAGAVVTGGVLISLISPASAASASGGAVRGAPAPAPASTEVERVQYGRSGTCAELRRACLYKRELGETGQGNCSRYRSECSNGSGYTSHSRYRYREYRTNRPYYRAYRPWRYYD